MQVARPLPLQTSPIPIWPSLLLFRAQRPRRRLVRSLYSSPRWDSSVGVAEAASEETKNWEQEASNLGRGHNGRNRKGFLQTPKAPTATPSPTAAAQAIDRLDASDLDEDAAIPLTRRTGQQEKRSRQGDIGEAMRLYSTQDPSHKSATTGATRKGSNRSKKAAGGEVSTSTDTLPVSKQGPSFTTAKQSISAQSSLAAGTLIYGQEQALKKELKDALIGKLPYDPIRLQGKPHGDAQLHTGESESLPPTESVLTQEARMPNRTTVDAHSKAEKFKRRAHDATAIPSLTDLKPNGLGSLDEVSAPPAPRRPSLSSAIGQEDLLHSLKHLSELTGRMLKHFATSSTGGDVKKISKKGNTKNKDLERLSADVNKRVSTLIDSVNGNKHAPNNTDERTAADALNHDETTVADQHIFTRVMESIMTANDSRDVRRKREKDKLRQWNRYSKSFAELPNEGDESTAKPLAPSPTDGPPKEPLEALQSQKVHDAFQPIAEERRTTKASRSRGAIANTLTASSLYAELFPESAESKTVSSTHGQVTAVLGPDVNPPPASAKKGVVQALQEGGLIAPNSDVFPMQNASVKAEGKLPHHAAALLLRGVSVDLTEDDIRRLVPRGKHLPDWYAQGGIIHVIPRRDPQTLQRYPDYYLVFRNESSADKYRTAAQKLIAYAAQYTPSSIFSPIMPGKGQTINAIDIATVVQSFTLAVPSQKLHFESLPKPWDPFLKNIFARGGYPQIMPVPGLRKPQVLLTFEEGFYPSRLDIAAAIARDGRLRNLPWRLAGSGEESVRRLEKQDVRAVDDHNSGEQRSEPRRARDGGRWVIAFQDEVEARRFALKWQMKPLPIAEGVLRGRGLSRDEVPICLTEVLW